MSRVLVTGSTGFLGSELCVRLAEAAFPVRGVVRRRGTAPVSCSDEVVIKNIDGATRWSEALEGVDSVVHLAAKVHHTAGSARSVEYFEVNGDGTRELASAAARAGVRRFIYLSSVKVNGSSTSDRPFRADDEVRPDGAYGYSKCLGEKYLREVSAGTPMEAIIVRPPLVYGPRAKANFLALLRWVDRGWPLPVGSVQNLRSLVSIWNLNDFIATLLQHPRSIAGTWMISDGKDLSTATLIELMAGAMNRRVRLLSLPKSVLGAFGLAPGIGGAVERLCGSLVVDISATVKAFGWKPPVSVEDGISRTVAAYLRAKWS